MSDHPAERALAVVSGVVTLALVAYLSWQAITAPKEGAPRVEVVGSSTGPDGTRHVDVRLVNVAGTGLLAAEVDVRCGADPILVLFENVPARGERSATVACPGESAPEVRVAWWKAA